LGRPGRLGGRFTAAPAGGPGRWASFFGCHHAPLWATAGGYAAMLPFFQTTYRHGDRFTGIPPIALDDR